MNDLHADTAAILIACLGVLTLLSTVSVAAARGHAAVEWIRRGLLAVVVAQAAIGLALVLRGDRPAEWIHWLYGPAIIAALLLPGTLGDDHPAGRRTGAVAVGSGVATVFAWRLWASG